MNNSRRWILAAITLITLLTLQTGCDLAVAPTPIGNDWYQVYFTAPQYPDKVANHHGGLDERLAGFIKTAQSSVDMAIYLLDLPSVTQAVLDARQRGVTVRVVTDMDTLQDPQENPSFKRLQEAGIPVVGGNLNAIMHNKFVVVDRAAVWTGSWNFSTSETYRNNNNAILIRSGQLAHNYTVVFEKMFTDRKFGPSRKPGGTTQRLTIGGVTVENYFAPEDNVADKITARLKQATHTIDFMAFAFTDDDIGRAVMDRAKAGVQVRGVFESANAKNEFSEYDKSRKAGVEVWLDGNPYSMHHKVFIMDGKTVILGSFNFSQNAETENDENLLIVDDPALAQTFAAEFERVLAQAKNPPKK
jgi:phosphatidylserine/phosphatidylglycerophosphate/cardiolipin synthase-like enzyme